LNHKILAAVVAVAMALTGVLTEMRWLTVVALVFWVVAMLYYGLGQRGVDRSDAEAD
jgi:hypothetical protein